MPQTVTYSGSAVASTGASISFSRSLPAEGVNVISVALAKTETKTVSLGASEKELLLLAVKPTPPADLLTFKIDGGGSALKLDQPFILGGSAAIAMLGATISKLVITNGTADAATVEIFVARDPTT